MGYGLWVEASSFIYILSEEFSSSHHEKSGWGSPSILAAGIVFDAKMGGRHLQYYDGTEDYILSSFVALAYMLVLEVLIGLL